MRFQPLEEIIRYTSRHLGEMVERPAAEIRHVVAPYRICPLGAHVDHQDGDVLGRTIDAYSVLAFTPINQPKVRLYSANYTDQVIFSLDDVGSAHFEDWDRYARGAAHVLGQRFPLRKGFCGFVYGTLPGGGLGSSASIGLAYLYGLGVTNDFALDSPELIELDRQLENDYLGLQNCILDQTTTVHGRQDALLYINIKDQKATPIADPAPAQNYGFVIAYSGFSRELTAKGYNDRVDECHQVASILARQAGQPDVKCLGDITAEVYEARKHTLPANLRRRAAYYLARPEEGIHLL